MKAVIQRVSSSSVTVDNQVVGAIGRGIMVLLGVEKGDDEPAADWLAEKICGLRIFPDGAGKMNLSVKEVGGALLVVSQFTLAADTKSGMRPSFSCDWVVAFLSLRARREPNERAPSASSSYSQLLW